MRCCARISSLLRPYNSAVQPNHSEALQNQSLQELSSTANQRLAVVPGISLVPSRISPGFLTGIELAECAELKAQRSEWKNQNIAAGESGLDSYKKCNSNSPPGAIANTIE